MPLFAIIALMLAPVADHNGDFDSVTGYRVAHYRGVVAAPPEGIRRIDSAETAMLHRRGAVMIDVSPAPGGVGNPAKGELRLSEPHVTMRRAHWFPEAGRGDAGADVDQWLIEGVGRLAHNDRHRTIVVFCLADCWMSWNASLKLHRAGFTDVRWFADGLDGWRDRDGPTQPATVAPPLPSHPSSQP